RRRLHLRESIIYGASNDSAQKILAIGKMAIQGANAQMCSCGNLIHLQFQPAFGKNGQGLLDNTRSIGHSIGTLRRYFSRFHTLLLPLATGNSQKGSLTHNVKRNSVSYYRCTENICQEDWAHQPSIEKPGSP